MVQPEAAVEVVVGRPVRLRIYGPRGDRVRTLVDGDRRLTGLISIGDLNAYETSDHEQTIYLLQEYLYGRV